MEEDKDIKAAKEHYKKLKERLKDTKIDYAKLEADGVLVQVGKFAVLRRSR